MHPFKWWLLAINALGGVCVLGSYAWGLGTHPGSGTLLWGGTPTAWQRLSTANMLPAALGYLAFTTFLLALIAIASLGLLAAVGSLPVRRPAWAWRLALVGCAVFCLQTVIFDAMIWSVYFRP